METILAFLGTKVAAYLAGAGGAAVGAGLAIKFGKPKVQRWLESQISKALNPSMDDPKARELFQAWFKPFLAYAEYMLPDRGDGKIKERVAGLLSKYMAPTIANAIGTVVQEFQDSADDVLDKAIKP